MARPERSSRHRIGRIIGSAFVLTSWLAVSAVWSAAPVFARTCGTITIEDGTVSPGSGQPDTTFTFSVRVSDTTGAAPDWVRVRVRGSWLNLAGSGDSALGVTYSGSRKLPAGTWPYLFRARSASGQICDHTQVSPATVVVKSVAPPPPTPVPTPTPTPTPKPTPPPTPTPTPTPTAKATPTPTPKPGATAKPRATRAPTPKPTARSGGGTTSKATGGKTPRPAVTPRPPKSSAQKPSATPGPIAEVVPEPTETAAVPAGIGGTSDGGPGSGFIRGQGSDLAALPGAATPIAIPFTAAIAGALLFLFLLLARRRRRRDPSTMVLALAGAGSDPGSGPDDPGEVASGPAFWPAPGESAAAVVGSAATFPKPPAKGIERAKVGYRRVRISSEPDEVRSMELGRLDRGDEVEILGSHEGFLQIRTPDAIVGWILRHTIVGAPT